MSPTSYQAALPCDIKFSPVGAGDRGRTGTILSYHGILSPGRLPVPPHRQASTDFFASYRSAYDIIPHIFLFVKSFIKIIRLLFSSLFSLLLYGIFLPTIPHFLFFPKILAGQIYLPRRLFYFSSSAYSEISIFARSAGDILPLVFSK